MFEKLFEKKNVVTKEQIQNEFIEKHISILYDLFWNKDFLKERILAFKSYSNLPQLRAKQFKILNENNVYYSKVFQQKFMKKFEFQKIYNHLNKMKKTQKIEQLLTLQPQFALFENSKPIEIIDNGKVEILQPETNKEESIQTKIIEPQMMELENNKTKMIEKNTKIILEKTNFDDDQFIKNLNNYFDNYENPLKNRDNNYFKNFFKDFVNVEKTPKKKNFETYFQEHLGVIQKIYVSNDDESNDDEFINEEFINEKLLSNNQFENKIRFYSAYKTTNYLNKKYKFSFEYGGYHEKNESIYFHSTCIFKNKDNNNKVVRLYFNKTNVIFKCFHQSCIDEKKYKPYQNEVFSLFTKNIEKFLNQDKKISEKSLIETFDEIWKI